jgi:hypothetical protein
VDIGAYEYQDNTAFVRIQKPYFHEYLVSNLYYDLKWNLSDSLSFVKLLYSPDKGVTWQTITASTPNYGVYKWKVPEIFADSCLWAVVDMAKPTIGDTSRYYFTISPNIIPDGCKFYGKLMEKYSPYQILGKVEIPKDSVLMIEPGTEIKLKTGDDFSEDYRSNDKANVGAVFVYGKLVANGLQNKIIRFTRLENNGKWGSVVFDSSSKKNTLEYCSFQYSNRYEMIIGSSIYLNGGTINIYSDSVSVKNSYFHHAYNGIYTNYKAKGIIIKNCVISNNENNGIDGYNGNAINCTITNNKGTGVYATFNG